jgi:hypothetical protein
MCENLFSIENCIKDSKIISNSVSRIATYMKNGTQLVSLYEDMMPFLLGSYYLKLSCNGNPYIHRYCAESLPSATEKFNF